MVECRSADTSAGLPVDQKVAIERTTKHFQDLCAVLQLPKGSAERAAATIALATEHGYSVATAYRNMAIVEEMNRELTSKLAASSA